MPWGRHGWGQQKPARTSVKFAGMWCCFTCGYHSPPHHHYCDRCSAPYGKSGHNNRHGGQDPKQHTGGGGKNSKHGQHPPNGGREHRRAEGGTQARRRDGVTFTEAVVNGKPSHDAAKAADDDEEAAHAVLSKQFRQALANADAVEKVLKAMSDPPEALQTVAKDLRAKAELLRAARQQAKDPALVAKEQAARLEAKSKQLSACKTRLEQAKSDSKYHEDKLAKAQAAAERESDLLERLATEIKDLHRELGSSPPDRDDEEDEEEEDDEAAPPRPSSAAGRTHLRGTAMDLDDPHQLGLAALLAGQAVGGISKGGRASGALARTDSAERRSRSPKQTRVAEAAAAIEAKQGTAQSPASR
jgi:hypothetical protein